MCDDRFDYGKRERRRKKNKENCFEDTPYEKPPYNTE
jgi:hypothetical protein